MAIKLPSHVKQLRSFKQWNFILTANGKEDDKRDRQQLDRCKNWLTLSLPSLHDYNTTITMNLNRIWISLFQNIHRLVYVHITKNKKIIILTMKCSGRRVTLLWPFNKKLAYSWEAVTGQDWIFDKCMIWGPSNVVNFLQNQVFAVAFLALSSKSYWNPTEWAKDALRFLPLHQ